VTAEVPLNLPKPVIQSVSNGASYQPGCAAATWIMIAGINLSTTTRSWAQSDFVAGKLPTQLDSSSTVGDAKFPQLVDSTRGDAFHSEILVSQSIHK
jgi:hypothetical protein